MHAFLKEDDFSRVVAKMLLRGLRAMNLILLLLYISEFLDQFNAFLLHETGAGKPFKVVKHLSFTEEYKFLLPIEQSSCTERDTGLSFVLIYVV